MRLSEIQKCAVCGQGLAKSNVATYYRLDLAVEMLDYRAIQRAQGLEMLIGNAAIARAMGQDEKIGVEVARSKQVYICFDCGCKPLHDIYERLEMEDGQDLKAMQRS